MWPSFSWSDPVQAKSTVSAQQGREANKARCSPFASKQDEKLYDLTLRLVATRRRKQPATGGSEWAARGRIREGVGGGWCQSQPPPALFSLKFYVQGFRPVKKQ